jgi:hypothetical protein
VAADRGDQEREPASALISLAKADWRLHDVNVDDPVPLRHAVLSPSRTVIEFCVGHSYRVDEIDSRGLFVLDVSCDIDSRFGGGGNDIRVELDWLTKTEAVE